MHKAYIGIGSNLQQPGLQIRQAFKSLLYLSSDQQLQCSSLYQSSPMGDISQPDYLNAVACLNTEYSALDLLDALQKIEAQQGRKPGEERWSPRTLDLDLLLFDQETIDHARLTVPHSGLCQRNFVIYPLVEIAPDLVLPNGTAIRDLYQSCSSKGITKIE